MIRDKQTVEREIVNYWRFLILRVALTHIACVTLSRKMRLNQLHSGVSKRKYGSRKFNASWKRGIHGADCTMLKVNQCTAASKTLNPSSRRSFWKNAQTSISSDLKRGHVFQVNLWSVKQFRACVRFFLENKKICVYRSKRV